VLGVEQSRAEVVQMGQGVVKMMDWIRELAFDGTFDERLLKKVFHREEVLDNIQARSSPSSPTCSTRASRTPSPRRGASSCASRTSTSRCERPAGERAQGVPEAPREAARAAGRPARGRARWTCTTQWPPSWSLVSTAYAERRTLLEADVQRANQAILGKVKRLRERTFINVGTAPPGGAFFVVGGALTEVLAAAPGDRGWQVTAEATSGSQENIRRLTQGELDFALSNAAITYFAVRGGEGWDRPTRCAR
jgi:hypothetical protein